MSYHSQINAAMIHNELRRLVNVANTRPPINLDLTLETLSAIHSVIKNYEGHPALEPWDNIITLAQKYNAIIHALDAHSIPHNCKPFRFS